MNFPGHRKIDYYLTFNFVRGIRTYSISVEFRGTSGFIPTHFRLDTGSFWKILGRAYDQ